MRRADNEVEALVEIADALDGVASALRRLGTADAATPMGALEAHGVYLKEEVAPALTGQLETEVQQGFDVVAAALQEGLLAVAKALRKEQ